MGLERTHGRSQWEQLLQCVHLGQGMCSFCRGVDTECVDDTGVCGCCCVIFHVNVITGVYK